MMKLKTMIVAVAVAAVLPVAALADPATSADKANGARACTALKVSMGAALFSSTYANFGKCVSAWTRAAHQNRHEASVACKAEQADAGFAAAHDGKTFAQFYGVGKQGANALNRCIQAKLKAATVSERLATVKAAKLCRAERNTSGAEAFKAKYGIGATKANAFGKCVSKLAQEQQQG
jgi:hypothetical protein